MIKRHKKLHAANGDTIIWKYMSVSHFLFLITHSLLYFSRVDHLKDKAEILVSNIEKQYWKDRFKSDLDSWIEKERKRVFINCWIKSEIEISTMWDAYASNGEGIAIKSTVNRLINSYQGEEHINILDVNYIDHKKESVHSYGECFNAHKFFSTKRILYWPENELRLIFESQRVDQFESFQIPIHLNTLIQELRIGPNVSREVFESIKKVVSTYNNDFPVLWSELLYP